jgi:RNA polymerase sigma-70 factor (ECF subfamily)
MKLIQVKPDRIFKKDKKVLYLEFCSFNFCNLDTTIKGDDWFLQFRDGEEAAFRHVFDKYYRSVSYFATKILRDDSFAEDIVSETFRKAWDRRDKFATPRHLENFLYLVTRNGCISHLRSGRVSHTTAQEWVRIAEDRDQADSIDLERVQARLLEVIFDKMQQLPGGDVLRMAYIEGKSTQEIAAALDTTENNVYIIKSRSLKALRSMLTKKEWMFFVLLFIRP